MTKEARAAIEDRKKEIGITGDDHAGRVCLRSGGTTSLANSGASWKCYAAMASMIGSAFMPLARKAQARK